MSPFYVPEIFRGESNQSPQRYADIAPTAAGATEQAAQQTGWFSQPWSVAVVLGLPVRKGRAVSAPSVERWGRIVPIN